MLDTDGLLGHISLIGSGGKLTDSAALGYWSHPDARGTGITRAGVIAVVAEAFCPATEGGGGMRRLSLVVAVGNVGSQRVAEAAGFQRTGRRCESDLLIDGSYTDEFTYTCSPLIRADPATHHAGRVGAPEPLQRAEQALPSSAASWASWLFGRAWGQPCAA